MENLRKSFLANFCHRQTYFIYLIPAFLLGCLFGYLFFGRVLQSTSINQNGQRKTTESDECFGFKISKVFVLIYALFLGAT
eukprot:UN16242